MYMSLARLRLQLARLARWAALTGLYGLLAVALLVSADVLIRKLLGVAFVGADEIAGYAMAMATSWALAFAFFQGSHIRVGIVHGRLSPRAQAWLDFLAVLATAAMVALLAGQVWDIAHDSWLFGSVSNTPLRVPLWLPQFVMLAGITLFLLSVLVVALEAAQALWRGQYAHVSALLAERPERQGPP